MPGKGNLQLTGKLGEVIRESAQIALSWVKSNAFLLGITTAGTDRATLRVEVATSRVATKASDDGAIDGASTACVVPVLWPVLLDRAARLANVLEISAAEILMLLDVEPKV